MSVDNLATVIGVNLIRSKVEDPAVIMQGTAGPKVEAGMEEVTTITTLPLIFSALSQFAKHFQLIILSEL